VTNSIFKCSAQPVKPCADRLIDGIDYGRRWPSASRALACWPTFDRSMPSWHARRAQSARCCNQGNKLWEVRMVASTLFSMGALLPLSKKCKALVHIFRVPSRFVAGRGIDAPSSTASRVGLSLGCSPVLGSIEGRFAVTAAAPSYRRSFGWKRRSGRKRVRCNAGTWCLHGYEPDVQAMPPGSWISSSSDVVQYRLSYPRWCRYQFGWRILSAAILGTEPRWRKFSRK
jgi:hypothetical protein